jgi:hypothetical protein
MSACCQAGDGCVVPVQSEVITSVHSTTMLAMLPFHMICRCSGWRSLQQPAEPHLAHLQ